MFGLDALSIGSSLLGAFGGSKGKKSTAQTKPYMPPEYEQGYQDVWKDFKDKIYSQQYKAPVYVRPGKYDSVALQYLQNMADQQPQQEAAPQQATQGMDEDAINRAVSAAMGRQFYNGGRTNAGVPQSRMDLGYKYMIDPNTATDDDYAMAYNFKNQFNGGTNGIDFSQLVKNALKGLNTSNMKSGYTQQLANSVRGM